MAVAPEPKPTAAPEPAPVAAAPEPAPAAAPSRKAAKAADKARQARAARKPAGKSKRGGRRPGAGRKPAPDPQVVTVAGGLTVPRDAVVTMHAQVFRELASWIEAAAGKHWRMGPERAEAIAQAYVNMAELRGWLTRGLPDWLMLSIAVVPWAGAGVRGEWRRHKRKRAARKRAAAKRAELDAAAARELPAGPSAD